MIDMDPAACEWRVVIDDKPLPWCFNLPTANARAKRAMAEGASSAFVQHYSQIPDDGDRIGGLAKVLA